MTRILKKKKGARKSARKPLDKKKEEYIRLLISLVEATGFTVRRERLKRGPNWSAQSGWCRVQDEPVLFVDRTVSQDDQLDFLVASAREVGVELDEANRELLPKSLVKMLVSESMTEAA